MPSASLWSKQTLLHLCPNYILTLSASLLHLLFLFLFWIQIDLLQASFLFLSSLFLIIHAPIFAACAIRLIVWWLLHFVAFGFFKVIIVTSANSLGCSPFLYMLLINCIISSRQPFPSNFSTATGTSSSPVAFLSLISLIAFSTSLCKT